MMRPITITLAAAISAILTATASAQPIPAARAADPAGQITQAHPQLAKALADVPADQAAGMRWLIAHLPEADRSTLDAAFLLENCAESYSAWRNSRWHASVPEDIFFDAILPYASINETRESWRKDFRERFASLVADAKTSSQAAAILNREIYRILNVKYSTKRAKADQCPSESIKSGLASCTGLSILLIDACRAVGVPARFAGTPLWSDKSGNHSWVEIWDNGWHFTGAAEPSGDNLNQAWFTDRASHAKRDDPMMAIYAVTWRDSSIHFPMVWTRSDRSVRAVNITDRYTTKSEPLPDGKARIRFRLTGSSGRLAARIQVADAAGNVVFEGDSKDERFDGNDHLTAILVIGQKYTLTAPDAPPQSFTAERDEQLIDIRVADPAK